MAAVNNTDEYLARFEENFAHPLLQTIRECAHQAVPELTEEIKWGAPSFEYKGRMFGMVAFKKEATREWRLAKAIALLEQGLGLNDQYRK